MFETEKPQNRQKVTRTGGVRERNKREKVREEKYMNEAQRGFISPEESK